MARTKGGEMKKEKEKLKAHFTMLSNGKVISKSPEKPLKNNEGIETLKTTMNLPPGARKKWRPVFSCKKHNSLVWERVMIYPQICYTSQAPIVLFDECIFEKNLAYFPMKQETLKMLAKKELTSPVRNNIKHEHQIVHERNQEEITSDQEIEVVVQSEEAFSCVLTSPMVECEGPCRKYWYHSTCPGFKHKLFPGD